MTKGKNKSNRNKSFRVIGEKNSTKRISPPGKAEREIDSVNNEEENVQDQEEQDGRFV